MRTDTRQPTTVGELLIAEFLEPLAMGRDELARRMGVEPGVVDDLVSSELPVTEDLADSMAAALGGSGAFWLNAQVASDEWAIER